MALNDKPCDLCKNFDPIRRGDGSTRVKHGWCAPRSVYPFFEPPGRKFPVGVRRVPEGELAQPHIVNRDEVVSSCAEFQPKATR